jgi:predicted metal-dependent phosphotriesterase family hydrolase
MPSNHSKWHSDYFGISDYPQLGRPKKQMAGEGLTVLDADGRLKPEVRTIVQVVADAGVCLATGHLSVDEIRALQDAAIEAGVERFIVTHANWALCKLDLDVQKELIAKGAYLEYVAVSCVSPIFWEQNPHELAGWISELGGDRLVLSSDLGQLSAPPHPEGMRMLVASLLDEGVAYEHLERMLQHNPAVLLDLAS